MSDTALPLDDQTQIYCDLGVHGWGEVIVAREGKLTAFRVSSVFTDLPQAMLDLCDAAIKNVSHQVVLRDEPDGVVVDLRPDPTQQHTIIMSFSEFESLATGAAAPAPCPPLLSFRIRRQRLVSMVLIELWKTHANLRQPSYQAGRDPFPHSELMAVNRRWDQSPLGPSCLH